MADRFGTMRVPFRVAVFDGPHSWPPPGVCNEAIEWLELRAMRGRHRATDSAWVRVRLQTDLARAAAEARKLADGDRLQAGDLQRVLRWARSLSDPPTSETLVRKLKIAKLKETTERGDSLQADHVRGGNEDRTHTG